MSILHKLFGNKPSYPYKKIIRMNGQFYRQIKPLKGRGQSAAAGFYEKLGEKKGETYLIKEDEAHISVLEGSAHWVKELLPPHARECLNFARCEVLELSDPNHTGSKISTTKMCTIQAGIKNARSLDHIIFNGRFSKSPISSEYWHRDEIKTYIAGVSDAVKNDLATALFERAALGDESLHTAQFMALGGEGKAIKGLIGIDVGARERFSYARFETDDFKHYTSQIYEKSGQYGKDYISFLLANSDVRAKYMYLWARLTNDDISRAVEKSVESLREQLNKVPLAQKTKTLNDIYDTFTKGSTKIRNGNISQKELEDMLSAIVLKRLTLMRLSAHQFIIEPVIQLMRDEKKARGTMSLFDDEMNYQERANKQMDQFYNAKNMDTLSYILKSVRYQLTLIDEKSKNKRIANCNHCLAYLRNQLYFAGKDTISMRSRIDELQIRINMITQLTHYSYQPRLINKTISQLINEKNDPYNVIEKFKKDIPLNKGWFFYPSTQYSKTKKLLSSLKIESEKYRKMARLEPEVSRLVSY